MAEVKQIFSNAPIKYEAYVRGGDDDLIHVFSIETSAGPTLFEADYEFAANGNDFWVLITNFGLYRKSLAGSRAPAAQRGFSSREIESATDRIREYFSGPEEKDFLPFNTGKGHFLGVKFTPGWAVLKPT